MTLTRRSLSLGTMAFLAACGTTPTRRAVMVADAQAVVVAVTVAYAAVSASPSIHVPLNVDAQIRSALASATSLANGLPAAVDAIAAASGAQGVVSAISAVLNLVAPVLAARPDVPPAVVRTFQAATVLLPLIAAAAALLAPQMARAGLVSGHAGFRSAMTAEQARAALR